MIKQQTVLPVLATMDIRQTSLRVGALQLPLELTMPAPTTGWMILSQTSLDDNQKLDQALGHAGCWGQKHDGTAFGGDALVGGSTRVQRVTGELFWDGRADWGGSVRGRDAQPSLCHCLLEWSGLSHRAHPAPYCHAVPLAGE